MKFKNKKAAVYLPESGKKAPARYMAVAAHQDDIEIMAADGILKAFDDPESSFYAVVVTNGAGSAREGIYKNYTDEEMMAVRAAEQKKAAEVGCYAKQVLLHYTSGEIKDPNNTDAVEDIKATILDARPEVLYTHNLADKHDTHIGTVCKVIAAIRSLPVASRPKKLYGCEVWRDLDWLADGEKVKFDLSQHPNLLAALLGVFDSQIAGGKRYDLAAAGRRVANATYSSSHTVDTVNSLAYAMDLTQLIENDTLDIAEFAAARIDDFKNDVLAKIKKTTK